MKNKTFLFMGIIALSSFPLHAWDGLWLLSCSYSQSIMNGAPFGPLMITTDENENFGFIKQIDFVGEDFGGEKTSVNIKGHLHRRLPGPPSWGKQKPQVTSLTSSVLRTSKS